jgi:hypothetical protein
MDGRRIGVAHTCGDPIPTLCVTLKNGGNPTKAGKAWNPHLRSTCGASGHHIQALDGEVGHVDDFVIDDGTWAIRYLVVDTHNWWPGKRVLVSPQWIENVSWGERKVFLLRRGLRLRRLAANRQHHGGEQADRW